MSTLPDLRSFFDPALTVPVGGKTYRVAPPSQAQHFAVREVIAGLAVSDREYLDRIMALLGASRGDDDLFAGGLLDELAADGLCWVEQVRVAETAALHFGDSAERARTWWAGELHAEAAAEAAAKALDEVAEAEKLKPRKAAAPRKTPAKKAK